MNYNPLYYAQEVCCVTNLYIDPIGYKQQCTCKNTTSCILIS